jgi:hypothetical protein
MIKKKSQAQLFKEAHLNAKPIDKPVIKGTIRERITHVLNNDILTVSQIATKSKTTTSEVISIIFEKKLIKVHVIDAIKNERVVYLLTTSTTLFNNYNL